MFTVHGDQPGRFCDGLSRRNFLRVGGLAAAGALTLPELLRRRAAAGQPAGRASRSS